MIGQGQDQRQRDQVGGFMVIQGGDNEGMETGMDGRSGLARKGVIIVTARTC